ncbi:hypothetical protein EIP86_008988 [Pleurotus ostreatoroseus]|nr:hypothetical protein EIP86_008988 [Pleurotus ostreatoroseus]
MSTYLVRQTHSCEWNAGSDWPERYGEHHGAVIQPDHALITPGLRSNVEKQAEETQGAHSYIEEFQHTGHCSRQEGQACPDPCIQTSVKFSVLSELIPASEQVEFQPEIFSSDLTSSSAASTVLNGAKSVIITSLISCEIIINASSPLLLHLLSYLETISDLSLSTVAVDAILPTVVSKLSTPLDIAFIVSLPSEAHDFITHSEETFEADFIQIVGAFENLEQTINIGRINIVVECMIVAGAPGVVG